jgi:hypothetical protein
MSQALLLFYSVKDLLAVEAQRGAHRIDVERRKAARASLEMMTSIACE